ncbi:MAG: rod shape-determining protein RodA [Bacteroidota bacterium]|nr:rod shape-determining protein RodA [Bacteroidota bacterium]
MTSSNMLTSARPQKNILGNVDKVALFLYIALVIFGWLNIYAAVFNDEHPIIFDYSQHYGKQFFWILTAFALGFIILLLDPKIFSTFAWVIYGFMILLLIVVIFAGKEVAGSKSWFKIGEFAIQPSEFAKFATNLAIAKYLSSLSIKFENFRTKVVAVSILLLPALLILLQNDTGSAIVYSTFVFVFYREGLSGNILIIGVVAIFLFVISLVINQFVILGFIAGITLILFYFIKKRRTEILILVAGFLLVSGYVFSINYIFNNVLKEHQKSRINVLLGKEVDLKKEGYNINQSKIAIGSGGVLGKGFLQGTQTKYNFVPEQGTDFIFCTVGEEYGFFGSILVIAAFIALLSRIIYLAEKQRTQFARIYGYGVACILFFHIMINIGMVLGVAPVIGIPLPFFSYGGSSLWSFTILLFIFLRQDSYRLNML